MWPLSSTKRCYGVTLVVMLSGVLLAFGYRAATVTSLERVLAAARQRVMASRFLFLSSLQSAVIGLDGRDF
jgi:hypothetical protein